MKKKTVPSGRLEVGRASSLNTKLRLEHVSLFRVAGNHSGEVVASPSFSYTTNLEPPVCADLGSKVVAVFPVTITINHVADGSRVPLGEVHVSMRAIYRKSPTFADEDHPAVEHYVGIVGWMHVWPYVRAEVQSLSTKLGFPPLVLPVLLSGQTANIPVQVLSEQAKTPADAARAKRKAKKSTSSRRGR